MALGWTPWERRAGRRPLAGRHLHDRAARRDPAAATGWRAQPLFRQSAESLLQSFKIWNTATVGGNIATALAAGALIGLGGALDAELVIWTPDGGERRERVADFVLAQRVTTIRPGEVVRSIEFAPAALARDDGVPPDRAVPARAGRHGARRAPRRRRRVRALRHRRHDPAGGGPVRRTSPPPASSPRRSPPSRPGSATRTAPPTGARASRRCSPRRSGRSSTDEVRGERRRRSRRTRSPGSASAPCCGRPATPR